MESASVPVAFPLLNSWLDYSYRPCTIPYRFPTDPPHHPTQTELLWLQLFRRSIPVFKRQAELDDSVNDAPTRAAKFADSYSKILDDLQSNPSSHGGPPDCILLCRLRELCLREAGFCDVFKRVKDEENFKALAMFSEVAHHADSFEDDGERLEHLVRGLLSGNIFDLGSAVLAEAYATKGLSFQSCFEYLVPRPWVIDDTDTFRAKWLRNAWKKVVIFVDNSGADLVLGILPLARELLRRGAKVILAANDLPAINDITYEELLEVIAKLKDPSSHILGVDAQNLIVVNSGNDLPVIDLSRVTPELAFAASDADLVILEGMGRGIETNLYAQFKCDALKVGVVKHPEVAEFLGGRLYDCVVKFTEGRT
eukprot:TRINITY_DN10636_c0_g1_i2.p1 TRINITY_DN10636_c0_g1~~TRINITY_DN10636_c0_g1_i2.p1  ORF type:complete len:368 (-),score=46.36 TRINITY_DN10636_c0_g1_i2:593-1696(-)